jgi:hypothetical protein
LRETGQPEHLGGAEVIRGEESMNNLRREPPIDELLRDPLTRLLMARDGVEEADLRRLLERIGKRLIRKPERMVA